MGKQGPEADSQTLERLGITRSTDNLSIELEIDPKHGASHAVFVPETQRWKLVCKEELQVRKDDSPHKRRNQFSEGTRTPEQPHRSHSAPWTDTLPQTEFVEFFKRVDWKATSLGPLAKWDPALQLIVNLLLADTSSAVIYWGPQMVSIHNDSMGKLAGQRLLKRTDFMGLPFNEIWPELVHIWEPLFQQVLRDDLAVDTVNIELFSERDFGLEEMFFTGTIMPLKTSSGKIEGFYNRASETTKETIRERRSFTLNAIAAPLKLLTGSVWQQIIRALEDNPRDFPLVMVYSADDELAFGRCILRLEGSLGVPDDHAFVPRHADLYEGKDHFLPYFRKAKGENSTIFLRKLDGSLPDDLLHGFKWRGFGDAPSVLMIIPIFASDRLISIIVFGLNPRRPLDEEYEGFLNNVVRQLSAIVSSAIDHEEALTREKRLNMKLEDTERQIRALAEHAPMGMCRIAPSGLIQWANDQFYTISGHSKDAESHYELSFVDIVLEEDQSTSADLWPVLLYERQKVSVTLRIKRKWTPPPAPGSLEIPVDEHAWILALAYPIIEDGEVTSIAGCITDISTLKWAEAVQTRSAEVAKEAKRLQENFIDVISHEMRNPLSAIIQCADGIETSLDKAGPEAFNVDVLTELHKHNVDAAKIILLCAQHQKRIIDDVLTLSKLDSLILSITPIAVQPTQIMESISTMFKAEFMSGNIKVENIIEESWHKNALDWLYLDPSRLTQIIINLVSNSIKFTKPESRREIKLRMGASLTKPPFIPVEDGFGEIAWFPTDRASTLPDITLGREWGEGEQVYLYFAVDDTGKGLEHDEMVKLFTRFQQASPRTHIKYGGSGLGLFISRELTELQGGEIGVSSNLRQGSTFAFYIKTRRAGTPLQSDRTVPTVSREEEPSSASSRNGQAESTPHLAKKVSSLKRQRISALSMLLVEDNLVNQSVLAKQLQRAGCIVQVANNGVEALDFIQKSKAWKDHDEAALEVDVILMDVEMPVMDGLTCTRRIRQLEEDGSITNHLAIIAITANARKEQIEQTLGAGVDAVQPKPFKVAELLAKVEELRGG